MSDSENRLEHLQVENDMTNESPGNIERTGGGEVAEDQLAHGEENNILEGEHGQFRRHRADPNSNIGYQEEPASNIGRLEDPLRNIGPDRHQFEEDPTRRKARFPVRTRDPFSYEDPTRQEARFPVRTRDPFSYEDPTRQEARFPKRTRDPFSHEDPTRREARFPMRTLDPFRALGVQEDSVRPEEPFHVHDDQSRYRWRFMTAKHRFCRALWEFFWKRELASNVSSNGAIYELEVGSEGTHGNATVNEI